MASFYDTLSGSMPLSLPDPYGRDGTALMADAVVVHIDSVIDYWWEQNLYDEPLDVANFPNLTPRFEVLFFEKLLKKWAYKEHAGSPVPWEDTYWGRNARVEGLDLWYTGLIVEAIDLAEDLSSGASRYDNLREDLFIHIGDRAYEEDVRWCLDVHLVGRRSFSSSPYFWPFAPLVQWLLPVRADGTPEPHMSGRPATLMSYPYVPDTLDLTLQRRFADAAITYLLPGLFAMAAMNSQETRLVSTGKHYNPRGRSYNLDFSELERSLDGVGKTPEFGLARAMNVCRDRFRQDKQKRKGRERP